MRSATVARRRGRRPHSEGRATFQPTPATEVAVRLLLARHPELSRTAAVRLLADLGAGQAVYDAIREERAAERTAAFETMMRTAIDTAPRPTGPEEEWDAAVMSLRGGLPGDG